MGAEAPRAAGVPLPEASETFYHSPAYGALHTMRDEVSDGRMVGVEGLSSPAAAADATLPPARIGR